MWSTIDEVVFSRGNKDEYGRHCSFVKMTDSVGMKRYRIKEMCLSAFAAQILLNKKGLSPKCWGMGSRIQKNGGPELYDSDGKCTNIRVDRIIWFFFTEIVVRFDRADEYKDMNFNDRDKHCRQLRDSMKKEHNLRWHDHNDFNAGIMDGKMCVIDTCESITDLVSSVEI